MVLLAHYKTGGMETVSDLCPESQLVVLLRTSVNPPTTLNNHCTVPIIYFPLLV